MYRRLVRVVIVVVACAVPGVLDAQTATYHLHKETDSNGNYLLKTDGPDAAAFTIISPDYKNTTFTYRTFAVFHSNPGTMNNGTIPAGSIFSMQVWMRKSSNASTVFPTLDVRTIGNVEQSVCGANGTTALTTTMTLYTVSCTSSSPVVVLPSKKFTLIIGGYFTAFPGNTSLTLQLGVEGTLNGNYDSTLVFPAPVPGASLTSLSQTSGIVGNPVTVSGGDFGATQGSNAITFNGVQAPVTSWTASGVQVTVPQGAATGDVLAWIGGRPSNSLAFTVYQPPVIASLAPAGGPPGSAFTINGSNFGATQGASTVTLNGATLPVTAWTDTSISTSLPAGASSGPVVITAHTLLSNALTFAVMPPPGPSSSYHLHKEASATAGLFQLKTAGPDGTSQALQTVDLKNLGGGDFVIKEFDTQGAFAPGGGTVPVGSTLSFTLWMKATAAYGALLPRVRAFLNNTSGPMLCESTGVSALSTTLTAQALSCVTNASVQVGSSDRLYLWTGIRLSTGPGNHSVKGELDVEGSLNGNFDSRISVPAVVAPPNVSSLNVTSGMVGQAVSISGVGFGSTQELGTVAFNGILAAVSSWSDTTIATTVPAGATTGPVVVTRLQSSNATPFAVLGSLSGTVKGGSQPLGGATVQALQGGQVVATATSSSNGTYSLGSILAGAYDVVAMQASFGAQLRPGVTVASGLNTPLDFTIATSASGSNAVTYTYDLLNRLAGVVSPTGESAHYVYDGVGNVLSIARQGTGAVAIFAVTPLSGYPGGIVTLAGAGFSPQLAQNVVRFNGVTATILGSTAAYLTVVVPVGAATGPIEVTTPLGTAVSSSTFSVTNNSGQPTITSFSPNVGSSGTTVTISGTNFDVATTVLRLKGMLLSISSATSTSLTTTIPYGATSGFFSVATPRGSAVATSDFFVVPSGTYPLSSAPVGVTARLALGQELPIALASGTKALLIFDAVAGQRVSIKATGVTGATNCSGTTTPSALMYLHSPPGYLQSPSGALLVSSAGQCNFILPYTLPTTGTYTLVVGQATNATITVYNVVDKTTGIFINQPPGTQVVDAAGQVLRFTFTGVAGQSISVTMFPPYIVYPCYPSTATLRDPSGALLATWDPCTYPYTRGYVLPATGTYTVAEWLYRGDVGNSVSVEVKSP